MSKDYAEELLQSIDTVISARLNDISYDRTIVCTITDASKRDYGQYTVTDGSTTFEAYSDNTTYMTNQQVQVTVPNGDWSAQKVIVSRYVTNDNPIAYRSPTSGITKTKSLVNGKSASIDANSDISEVEINIEDIAFSENNDKYLCIKALFKTENIKNDIIVSGSYGIRVKINNIVFQLDSEKDMFGDIYNFADFVAQEQAFSIPADITKIDSFSVELYQDNNFKLYQDNAYAPINAEALKISAKNIQIYFGGIIDGFGPSISTDEELYYYPGRKEPKDDCKRTVNLLWGEKDENGNAIELDKNAIITWYADTKEGTLKKLITKTTHETSVEIQCVKELTYTNVQAVVERIENAADKTAIYKSDILQFKNYESKTRTIPKSDLQLRINNVYGDNQSYAKDFYSCYDQYYNVLTEDGKSILRKDGKYYIIKDEKEKEEIFKSKDGFIFYDKDDNFILTEHNLYRTVQIEWISRSGVIDSSFFQGEGVKVEWEYPTENTMIECIEHLTTDIKKDKIENVVWNPLGPTLTYLIATTYSPSNTNNTIKCKITIPSVDGKSSDIVYELEKELSFSYKYINVNDGFESPPSIIISDIADEVAQNQFTKIDVKSYLTQENIFNGLTKGGTIQGLFKDDEGNLYINGSYIATGILRSNNWSGTLTYHYKVNDIEKTLSYQTFEFAEKAIALAQENGSLHPSWNNGWWSLSANSGMYIDLNEGKIVADNFELNAWKNNGNKGLYLNSNPSKSSGLTPAQSFIEIGDASNGNFINYNADGNMTIQTNNKFTLNAWKYDTKNNKYRGVYLDSEGSKNGIYFIAGDGQGDVAAEEDIVATNLIQVDKGGVKIAANQFKLDAWEEGSNQGGIYVDSSAANGYYFKVGGKNNYLTYMNDTDGTLEISGKITANTGRIGAWHIGSVNGNTAAAYNSGIYSIANDDTSESGGLYSTQLDEYGRTHYGMGFFNTADSDSPALWIGYTGGGNTPYEQSGWASNTKFYVTAEGKMYAKEVEIKGKIEASSLTTTGGGNLGGWMFDNGAFYKQSDDEGDKYAIAFTFGDVGGTGRCFGIGEIDDIYGKWGDNVGFSVTGQGKLAATGANITGTINADGGRIGGWNLWFEETPIQSLPKSSLTAGTIGENGSIHLYTYFTGGKVEIGGHKDENWRLTIGPGFGVNKDGVLYASEIWTIGKDATAEAKSICIQEGQIFFENPETNEKTFQIVAGGGDYTSAYIWFFTGGLYEDDSNNMHLTSDNDIYLSINGTQKKLTWDSNGYLKGA